MKNKITMILWLINFGVLLNSGCTKGFLDAKPSSGILQPVTLDEFEKILDNFFNINRSCALAVFASDEYHYSSDARWLAATTPTARNSYIWAKDLYEGEESLHWNVPYTCIFYANNVLEGLSKIEVNGSNSSQYNSVKGTALFSRAFAYYELISNFAPIYDASTASSDLGVPLRLKPSIDEVLPRSTVSQVYSQIFDDLSQALILLGPSIPAGRSRPSKAAVEALYSRIYLSIGDYSNAERHADACLKLYDKLIDYNTLNNTRVAPFPYNHDEQIYVKVALNNVSYTTRGTANGANTYIQITSELINLYEANDLRKSIYYVQQNDGSFDMKQGYAGPGIAPFTGLATDEIYLIKAECLARRNEITSSMEKLDQLKRTRWSPSITSPIKPYENMTATDAKDALAKVLLERRKELVWRGLRWDDLKRLNKEGAGITLTRTVNGQNYSLSPRSPRYVFPIPDNEISLSGIKQNDR
ncbi:RagB/SusD family nutrient uptake outer membrane protein [Pedobacter nyackensis]|uniref:RagB/SusD family nutrient uptake outer membrane protein n=1 Tax=Pedobacter nyackensis TaxID=475255 RepID=UPI0029303D7D|nr:RagB/SusD family nutrient uptake outer membrane protein [Pedobacter nyackensis]